jgi:hypothetical protein
LPYGKEDIKDAGHDSILEAAENYVEPVPAPVSPKDAGDGPLAKKIKEVMKKIEDTTGPLKPSDKYRLPRRRSVEDLGTFDVYHAKYTKQFQKVVTMLEHPEWVLSKTVNDTTIYTRHMTANDGDGDNRVGFKAETQIAGKDVLAHCLAVMFDDTLRKLWDPMCKMSESVSTEVPFYKEGHFAFKAPVPYLIADRDLHARGRIGLTPDNRLVVLIEPAVDPAVKTPPGHIRVEFEGAWLFTLDDPDNVKIVFGGFIEPNGLIPQFIKDLTVWKQGLAVDNFSAFVKNQASIS